ncbi:MAG TPA: hypothetical protein DCE41_05930, partial [Cytophagales bacterium]|nr:hypothetical protein [Cytophagales bacterium]
KAAPEPTPQETTNPAPAVQQEATEATPEPIKANDEPLSQENFATAWNAFWEEPERTAKQKSVRNNTYTLDLDSQLVTLSVTSTIQKDILAELREPLLGYLKRQLGKPKLQLEGKVVEITQERRPYTNQEKLQHLLEKQPKLQDLVDKLGLDPDL